VTRRNKGKTILISRFRAHPLRERKRDFQTVCRNGHGRSGSNGRGGHPGCGRGRGARSFSLLANLPGISASARCAARGIVGAVARKKAEIAITPQAVLAARLAQTIPEFTVQAMSVIDCALPKPVQRSGGGDEKLQEGLRLRERESFVASSIGWKAGKRYNQLG